MSSFQTFTGSGKRPRNVNLSGRPTNPFAASGPGASGPKSAVASAQHDRLQREQQRQRLQASSRIQRVFRGHSARRRTFATWRQIWDDIEAQSRGTGVYEDEEQSLRQLRRLLLFYRPQEDVKRLTWYGMRQMATESESKGETARDAERWPTAYGKLCKACTAALRARDQADTEADQQILTILGFAARRSRFRRPEDAVEYYEILTNLRDVPPDPLQNALLAPLQTGSREAYVGLAVLLARPLDPSMIKLLRSSIDAKALCEALDRIPESSNATNRSRLWLLGNFICLAGRSNLTTYTVTIARLLGTLADDVDFDGSAIDMDNIAFDRDVLSKVATGLPLNTYLNEQVASLVNQETIRNLLVRDSTTSSASDAQMLAGYALTLLRCFPRRADDIRMWLYLGPLKAQSNDIPATQYFWNAAKLGNRTFDTIRQDSRKVLSIIKSPSSGSKEDWTVILVFLELYTFLLKIMDDEEFMGNAYSGRNSAIPIGDVAELVTFLKNLGFTLYFHASELNAAGDASARDASTSSLSRHFGHGAVYEAPRSTDSKPLTLAGLPGLTIDYLKGLVTGLLRSIYERDSRRSFLPKDHWLMTDRFDMTAFIPGVVAEEESRHVVQEQDDEDKDVESEDDEVEPTGIRTAGTSMGRAAVLRSQEARERAQRKASRRRYLESVAPRLEILQNMPFFIPFTTRVEIFRQFVHLDQQKRRNGAVDPDLWRQSMMFQPPSHGISPQHMLARHHAKIKRKNEFNDAFEQFYDLGADLKEPIQITFVDEFDIPEAGIDGGGVTKEFLTSVITQAFDPRNENIEHAYFVENEKHLLHPNPTALEDMKARYQSMGLGMRDSGMRAAIKDLLAQYEFLGRIIGKCLYEGILVDVSFAGFFLKKWALTGGSNAATHESGYRANINDLRELDEGLYRGMLALKNAPAEQVEEFSLSFTVDDVVGAEDSKRVIERELIPNGANTPVTAENRLIYINRMSWYRLQGQSAAQTSHFLKGLGTIIQPSWLSMFNQLELQTLIGGAAAEIDLADLRRNTLYGGLYVIGDDGEEHPSIQLFWRVMESLPDSERRKVLKFVTSTPRGPLLGFAMLNPRFSIRDSGADEGRFPTASTCVNLLKLPVYRSEGVLRERLVAAVNAGAGFDLS
ncbi:putative E3 ubiquitin protein ligase [Teratosphaeria destructans]|uniref:HECT-type E3 ubiquitin transferase n=1 Tax=Teratosphaeria destructans TaxID=418781 RepID=A0A9W7SJJ7_9PEZI|nr:putative E3 ubiquitin protein ligase [Teratosphaeria destructans]